MITKSNRLTAFLSSLDKERLESIIGLENKDALRYGFPQAKVVHPGLSSQALDKSSWQNIWQSLLSQKGSPDKRVAYIHIPFCRSKCLYCGFFQNFCDDDLETQYINRLIKEMEMAASPYLETAPLQAVYIGGGSPSSLSPYNCARLLRGIRKYLPLANDCEITYESRIHDMSEERQETLFANGVNRISLGVQAFDTDLRRSMGRIDSKEEVLACLEQLSSHGQAAIIIDLIYGFPTQTLQMWQNDLQLLKKAPLDGFDLYHLKLHPGSALQKAIENNSFPAAKTMAEKAEMFAEAEKTLARYSRRSVCHWAKNHRERNVYNSLSKSGAQIIPFGCGAGGNIEGYNLFLERDIALYSKQIDNLQKPLMHMGLPHDLKKLSSAIIGQLDEGHLDVEHLADCFGEEIREMEELLAIWEKRGFLQREEDFIRLETPGRFWNVNIAQSLVECFHGIRENVNTLPEAHTG